MEKKARAKESLIDYDLIMWVCHLLSRMVSSSSSVESGLDHVTCFGQGHVYEFDRSRDLKNAFLLFHAFSYCFWNTAMGGYPISLLLEHIYITKKSTVVC